MGVLEVMFPYGCTPFVRNVAPEMVQHLSSLCKIPQVARQGFSHLFAQSHSHGRSAKYYPTQGRR
jgi:hypothetical protein